MVWAAIDVFRGPGPIEFIPTTLNNAGYKDLLAKHLHYIKAGRSTVSANRVFQQDNASVHTASVVKQFMETQGVHVLEWPDVSPDLNPIENLWKVVDQNIKKKGVNNKPQLVEAIKEAWKNIDKQVIRNLYGSMQQRLREVIKARGYYTKY